MRRTKVIVTIGPASGDEETLREFLKLNVDVLRINFSHGTPEEHLEKIKMIRQLAEEVGFNPAILLDLPGPKIRVGKISQGFIELKTDTYVKLKPGESASEGEIPISIENLDELLHPGERVLLVDGRIKLKVEDISRKAIIARVIRGGILHSNQGVNLPDSELPFPSLTERDKEGIELAFKEDVDWLALSFVRLEEDLIELKDLVVTRGEHMGVIAKIERPEAVRNIDKIIDAADAVMVARGDLGVEMGVEEVPLLQKRITALCKSKGKPSIIATQMLESMLENPYPSRAEVSDIANAIYDGVDCVMLSDETAIGKYPLDAVKVMLDVIVKTEESKGYEAPVASPHLDSGGKIIYDAIGHAGCTLAYDLDAQAIIVPTFSGFTSQMLSKYRPRVPIYAFTPDKFIRNKMNLFWGVYPFLIKYTESIEELMKLSSEILKEKNFLHKGDLIIFIAGIPLTEVSETNFIKVHIVK